MKHTGALSDPLTIRTHLQGIADLGIPVCAKSDDGYEVSDCRLLCQASNTNHIFVRLAAQQYPLHSTIHVLYTLDGVPYRFCSEIIGKAEAANDPPILALHPPKTIQSVNRRTFIRAKFPLSDALGFDITLSKNNSIRLFAEDISAGGIGFFVPQDLNPFALGNNYPIKFELPECRAILTRIDIRNICRIYGMMRIGSAFTALDVKQRMKIIELVGRMASRECLPAADQNERTGIGIFMEDYRALLKLWPFLETRYRVHSIDLTNHGERPCTGGPHLMLLNLDQGSAAEKLKAARGNGFLRDLPLIFVSAKYCAPPLDMPDVRFVKSGIKQEVLAEMIDQLVYGYQWSKKISHLNARLSPAPNVLVLDRCHALTDQTIKALEEKPYRITVIDNEREMIHCFGQIDPDAILIMHADGSNCEVSICRLMNCNKKLKSKPKILVTADKALANDLQGQKLVSQSLPFPAEAGALFQVLERVCPQSPPPAS